MPSEPIVETVSGKLHGSTQAGIHAFKGIPYGAPTAGAMLSRHIDDRCFWIWANATKDDQRVWFRRALELKRAGTLPVPAERIRLPRVKKLRRAARRGAAKTAHGKPRARTVARARRTSPAAARAPRSAPRGRRARKARKTG